MTSQAKLDEFAKKGLEAQKKYKKATTTNLLKWKIDWEQGARHARDMVKNFRCAGPEFRRDYIEALKCSAKAHEESNSIHTAGTEYEALAQALKEEKDWRGAAEANAQASRMFRGKSEWDKAALVLTRAAECVEEKEPSQALSYMDQACSIYEEQERYEFHEATFKKAIAMAVKLRRYDTAIEFIHRQNKIILHRMETFERDLYKNLLSIVVVRFAEREYEKAQAEFNQAQNMENFGRSEEWSAASDLFTAYSAGSNEELAEVLKRHSCFKYISVPVAQLARKLQFNAEVVAKGKQRAKEFLEGPDEPDSDEYETDDGEDEPEEKKVPPRKKPVAQEEEDEDEEEVKSVPPPKKAAAKKPVTRDDDDEEAEGAPPPTKRVTSATSSTSTGAKKSTRAALFDRDEPKSASSTRAALFSKNEPASASTRSALFAKSGDEAGSSARAALFAKDDSPKKKKVTSPKSREEKDEIPMPPNKMCGIKAASSNPFGDEDDDDDDEAPTSSPKKDQEKEECHR